MSSVSFMRKKEPEVKLSLYRGYALLIFLEIRYDQLIGVRWRYQR